MESSGAVFVVLGHDGEKAIAGYAGVDASRPLSYRKRDGSIHTMTVTEPEGIVFLPGTNGGVTNDDIWQEQKQAIP